MRSRNGFSCSAASASRWRTTWPRPRSSRVRRRDAPANTVETGIRVGEPPSAPVPVSDNTGLQRFESTADGVTAFLKYERTHDTLRLIHTEVPDALRGRHVGDALVDAALDAGRS